MSTVLYAHTGSDFDDESTWQTLSEHLNNVAETASTFAAEFGMFQWGRMLGLLHDAGKSSAAFEKRLRGGKEHVDHSTAGAKIAIERYGSKGYFAAYSLVGHHGGQPNGIRETIGKGSAGRKPLESRLNGEIESYDRFFELVESGEIDLPQESDLGMPMVPGRRGGEKNQMASKIFSTYALSRMIYSTLVDADYLDTEAFMAPEASLARRGRKYSTVEELSAVLEKHLASLCNDGSTVNRMRRTVLRDCLAAADCRQGLFSLTVPTGGGKTLSSLAFALKHACIHHMKRVIIAVPFVTVTEQTAQVLKSIFGSDQVLEHHSNYDYSDLNDEEAYAQRLATQNWDAPIIVTTNVQLFESLFASKPGKSRKVHNIAGSVVILDEAQTLPDHLLISSLAMLEELTFAYNTSVVLCTATQPALDMSKKGETLWPFGSEPLEITNDTEALKMAFGGRVRFEKRGELDIDDLVGELSACSQVLCVVGTKRGARRVYRDIVADAIDKGRLVSEKEAVDKGYYHLSTLMTPQHRSDVFEVIRRRLADGLRCVVVSTQLVEAGVDVDFPVVYREMAGIDSLVQAAGRCNREGKRDTGTVAIFDYTIEGERQKTSLWLEKMKDITRQLMDEQGVEDIESLVQPFFRRRYGTEDTDAEGVFASLTDKAIIEEGFRTFPFEQVSFDYRIIDDASIPLFIPRGTDGANELEAIRCSDNRSGFAMRLQRHSVSAEPWLVNELKDAGVLMEIEPFLVMREELVGSFYSDEVGLLRPGEEEQEMLFF